MTAFPAFGLGLAALGRPGYMSIDHGKDIADASVEGMRANAYATLDEAWRLGVRHFDAARSYGRAEEFLAEWLVERGHSGAFVSSKWGYRYAAGWKRSTPIHEVKDHSLANLREQLGESLRLLGPHLRLYQIHSLTPESTAFHERGVLDRLEWLRDSGIAVGASVSGPRQAELIDRVASIERTGRPLFGWVQATWNLLERSAGPSLERARSAGLRVIVKEALANGRLSARGDVPALIESARRLGATPDALSLSVALAQPFADVVLSGAANPAQLRSNLTARNIPISPEHLTEICLSPDAYWRERAELPWT